MALLLVARGQFVPVKRLISCVWGDDPPPSAGQMTRGHVMKLRRIFGSSGDRIIEVGLAGYRLSDESGVLDAELFERLLAEGRRHLAEARAAAAVGLLEQALAQWRGPFALEDVREIAELEAEAVRLEELRSLGEECLMDSYLMAGRAAEALPSLRRLTIAHPLRNRFWAQLMVALSAIDRPVDAADTFTRARRVFVEAAGMEPSPLLSEIHRAVLDGNGTHDLLRLLGAGTAVHAAFTRVPGTNAW
jgi:DNA-binding SARP family transcriptional activator